MILIHENIEFHNAAALEPLHGLPGLCPVRIPAAVRHTLNHGARRQGVTATGVELRFVTTAPSVRVAMAAHDENVEVHVYRGGFGHSDHRIAAGQTRVISVGESERFRLVPRKVLEDGALSPDLWRVQISGGTVGFLGLETFGHPVRPPETGEKPALRWLAHGSSITHSWALGYPHHAARRLGVDVLNKGLGGSCHCEETLAAYFAENETWDFASLELGINMRGQFTPEAFEERARNFVETLRAARPDAPLILITHFLNMEHHPVPGGANAQQAEYQKAFDEILRRIAGERPDEPTHLIEGRDLLTDFDGLTCDLIHPGVFGHIQMGENLARLMRPLLPGAPR